MAADATDQQTQEESRLQRLVRSPRLWVGLVIAALAVAFIAQNRDPAQIDLLTFQLISPQWVTLLAVFLAGLATGALWGQRRR